MVFPAYDSGEGESRVKREAPAEAGIHKRLKATEIGLRRCDENRIFEMPFNKYSFQAL